MRIATLITTVVLLSAVTSYAADTVIKDTRLVQAAKTGDTTTAVALLNRRVDPNVAEPDGTTALQKDLRGEANQGLTKDLGTTLPMAGIGLRGGFSQWKPGR